MNFRTLDVQDTDEKLIGIYVHLRVFICSLPSHFFFRVHFELQVLTAPRLAPILDLGSGWILLLK